MIGRDANGQPVALYLSARPEPPAPSFKRGDRVMAFDSEEWGCATVLHFYDYGRGDYRLDLYFDGGPVVRGHYACTVARQVSSEAPPADTGAGR